ncbi:FAD-dependent oxidoreductase [Bradyrhizobium sp. ARR65]|uniref:FAD-dependent oxidoreductase n=1 Tax=Bradyrhizobium sp. ARR65 TaxID=1040989 RepID=UPI0004639C24|nr:FAD-dependent oxidoreductase [Bradyrhizobium sp. ARR65]
MPDHRDSPPFFNSGREIGHLQAIAERLSPVFQPERIIARQAYFRPVTQDGLPLIGKVPQSEGVYVATGHSVWGILNAPATGEPWRS